MRARRASTTDPAIQPIPGVTTNSSTSKAEPEQPARGLDQAGRAAGMIGGAAGLGAEAGIAAHGELPREVISLMPPVFAGHGWRRPPAGDPG